MSIERVFCCDWRECDSHTRTADSEPGMGFLTVSEDGATRHFCSWDCVLKQAAEVPPVEVVGAE
jgi:ribosomal protein L24E